MNEPSTQAFFDSRHTRIPGWSGAFAHPREILEARTPDEVIPLLDRAWNRSLDHNWVVLFLSYEAASAFDCSLKTHTLKDFPLAWAAIFPERSRVAIPPSSGTYSLSSWTTPVSQAEYMVSLKSIQEWIGQGETYQVNYTLPFVSRFSGDDRAWFEDLARTQGAPYSARLDLGRYRILSLSPELFFRRDGDRLTVQPMKGTAPRGRWIEEDRALARGLHNCPKNRAENVMIVDLLRNDLGRISVPGSVKVEDLYQVKTYNTVLQMVSTISSRIDKTTTLSDIFRGLFPSGSVTGAPKIRTMELINRIEPNPRTVYTGALGYVKPGGDCIFNVPIRTVVIDTRNGTACCHVGSGITHYSSGADEYQECLTKLAFLRNPTPPFRLLETLGLKHGRFVLLDRHLNRMAGSAEYFGFPFPRESIVKLLEKLSGNHSAGSWKVRLLLDHKGNAVTEVTKLQERETTVLKVGTARTPVFSSNRFLFHKTTHREIYDRARKERPDCDEVILINELGELTEGTHTNLIVDSEGNLGTPPLSSGLLPGTLRQELLDRGEISERTLTIDDLEKCNRIWMINSVRGWMPAELAADTRKYKAAARKK